MNRPDPAVAPPLPRVALSALEYVKLGAMLVTLAATVLGFVFTLRADVSEAKRDIARIEKERADERKAAAENLREQNQLLGQLVREVAEIKGELRARQK